MYIFTLKETVLGICDEEHLVESVKRIWEDSCKEQTEKDIVIYQVEPNKVDYDSPFATYYFDKYDDETKLGLRLVGLGGAIDMPLDIRLQELQNEVNIPEQSWRRKSNR